MGIGGQSDVIIYEPEFVGGAIETSQQFAEAFNESSRGAINLVVEGEPGHFTSESYFKNTVKVVRRDTSDLTTDLTPVPLKMDENVTVKLDRRTENYAQTVDSFKKMQKEMPEYSLVLGQQYGVERQLDFLNTAILAGFTAINNQVATAKYNATGESVGTMIPEHLIDGTALFGDRASRIVAWVMHSKPFFQLMKSYVTKNIFEAAGMVVIEGSTPSMGYPIIVTDSPSLVNVNASTGNTYNTLGLTVGALEIKQTEDITLAQDIKSGKENIYHEWQAEHSFNVGVKGYKWKKSEANENPSDTTLGTGSNWIKTYDDIKATAGVVIETAAA